MIFTTKLIPGQAREEGGAGWGGVVVVVVVVRIESHLKNCFITHIVLQIMWVSYLTPH